MDETLVPLVTGSCDAVNLDSSPQESGCGSKEEEFATDAMQDREGSEAVRLLDEELAELEQLMRLQRRKVDALERLRKQWLSGERELPEFPVGSRLVGEAVAGATGNFQVRTQGIPNLERGGYDLGVSPPPSQLSVGISEQYMAPHTRFPVASPVVAAELLSFRLKGTKSRSSSSSSSSSGKQRAAGGVRSGFLNVFAFLHADGSVRLRDTDGEEIVAFDAGHRSSSGGVASSPASVSSPYSADADSPEKRAAATEPVVVVGLTADTSEAGPVVATAGADGTVRVHALTVHYRGKRVAGAGAGGSRSRRKESTGKRKEGPVGGSSGERDGGSRPRNLQEEETPPRTATQTGEAAVEENRTGNSGGGGGSSSSSSSSSRRHDVNSGRTEASKTNEVGGSSGGGKSRSPPTPPATAMGVGIAVEFKACLGSACDRSGDGSRLQGVEAAKNDVGDAGAGSVPRPGETATVTSMDSFYHRSLGTTVVVAGYSSGGVSFFHAGNGTELGSADTGGGAVLAIKRSGQSIAFSDGEDVHFASAAKFTRTTGRVCRGARRGRTVGGARGDRAMVTALAFDAVSTGVLYVGFETGEVMAYDSRIQEADGSYTCLPSHRLPPPPQQQRPLSNLDASAGSSDPVGDRDGGWPEGRCESISTVRGYAMVSQGPLLSVYNTTDEASQLVFTRLMHTAGSAAATMGQEDLGTCGGGVLAATAVREADEEGGAAGGGGGASAGGSGWSVMSSSASGEVLVAEASRCSAEMVVYRAALPYERHGPDISWMRAPVLLLGLLVVAITQVYSRRAAKTAVGRTSRNQRSGRVWGEDDFSDDDGGGGGGGLSVDSLSRLGGGLGERRSGSRGWDGMRESRGGPRAPSSRLPPPRRDYGNAWSQDDSD
eukprot:g14515.t2